MSATEPPRSRCTAGPATCTIVASSRFIASAVSRPVNATQRPLWTAGATSVMGSSPVRWCHPPGRIPFVPLRRTKLPILHITWASLTDMTTLDDLDRALIHALQVDGRAPFPPVATVLGPSTQPVIRRYRRLRGEAGLRVIGLPDPLGAT